MKGSSSAEEESFRGKNTAEGKKIKTGTGRIERSLSRSLEKIETVRGSTSVFLLWNVHSRLKAVKIEEVCSETPSSGSVEG